MAPGSQIIKCRTLKYNFKQKFIYFYINFDKIDPFWYGNVYFWYFFSFWYRNVSYIPGTGITQNLRLAECKLLNLHSNGSPTICALNKANLRYIKAEIMSEQIEYKFLSIHSRGHIFWVIPVPGIFSLLKMIFLYSNGIFHPKKDKCTKCL